ncbi:MAG: hypothetical protein ACLQFM_13750 [Terriglobales bacterium]|jgi:hypothetical protein
MNAGPPHRPTNLRISVKVNRDGKGGQESVETDLFCDKGNCGKEVEIYSNGPNTTHNVVCIEQGLLTSFPNYETLKKFTESCANKILAARGHGTITEKTNCISVDDHPDPKSVN